MKLNKILWLSARGMYERKLRVALTVLSVVIGVTAIVALISVVAGISASISHSLESIGPTTLYMMPSGSHIFTAADVAEIESLPNVSSVTPIVSFDANITEGGTTTTVTVYGISNYSLAGAIGSIDLYSGSVYNDTNLPYALVGYDVAFPTTTQTLPSVKIGEPIYLTMLVRSASSTITKSITLIPVGILNKYGTAAFVSPDGSVFVPLQVAESLSNTYSYTALLVKAKNVGSVNALDSLLSDIYGNDARILSVQAIASTVSSITGSLGLLLAAIAGISLLVAGISILSIMMVSVAERTHEIGILKSIGFKRKDVMTLFLSEGMIIGLAGGIIGVILGSAAAYAIPSLLSLGSSSPSGAAAPAAGAAGFRAGGGFGGGAVLGGVSGRTSSASASSFSFTPVISPVVIAVAILIAVVVSMLASAYPAWKASTIDPIRALRTE